MNKMIIAGVAGAFLASSAAMASEPVKLTDGQMDDVTAGFRLLAGLNLLGSAGSITAGVGTSSTTQTQAAGSENLSTINIGTGGTIAASDANATLATSSTTTGYTSTLGGGSFTGGALGVGLILLVP